MFSQYSLILVILTIAAFAAVSAGKLTAGGGMAGWIIGLLVFMGTGYAGVAMMATFFILATVATSVGFAVKQRMGLAETGKGKRTAGQVIANAGVAGILGLLMVLFPRETAVLQLMVAASLASATADTLSSELGNVFGRKFYNILTLKKDKRGLDGVVSVEGTLLGVIGSGVIAVVYVTVHEWNESFFLIVLAGTIGNLADSVLGATLERKKYLDNNEVNFLNTFIAAITSLVLYYITF
ncbi:MAG: hypothetical protein JWQ40_1100 [Segetibacter sp.]|nr:hypothetical protein [Segetibacter sp.]